LVEAAERAVSKPDAAAATEPGGSRTDAELAPSVPKATPNRDQLKASRRQFPFSTGEHPIELGEFAFQKRRFEIYTVSHTDAEPRKSSRSQQRCGPGLRWWRNGRRGRFLGGC
jgi:hypothetical protein